MLLVVEASVNFIPKPIKSIQWRFFALNRWYASKNSFVGVESVEGGGGLSDKKTRKLLPQKFSTLAIIKEKEGKIKRGEYIK